MTTLVPHAATVFSPSAATLLAPRAATPHAPWAATLGQFLIEPMAISGLKKVALILPLLLAVAIVYKATRLENLRQLPRVVLSLWLTMFLGMYAVGVGLWVVYLLMI